jgi:hypothetical protein
LEVSSPASALCCCVDQVAYDITTSVGEAVEQMANLIRLTNFQTFTLYEATRPINFKSTAEPLPEEHMLLDENRCAWTFRHSGFACLELSATGLQPDAAVHLW